MSLVALLGWLTSPNKRTAKEMMQACSEHNCTTPFSPMPRLLRSAFGSSLAECLQFSESKLQRQPLHLHCSLALQSSLFKSTHFFSHHLSGFFEPPIILVVWHPPTAAWCITPSSSAPRSARNATVTRSKLQSKAARMDGNVSQTAGFLGKSGKSKRLSYNMRCANKKTNFISQVLY